MYSIGGGTRFVARGRMSKCESRFRKRSRSPLLPYTSLLDFMPEEIEKPAFLIRELSTPSIAAQAFLGLAQPAQIKVFTPAIPRANQPQTFNMPNGTVLWMIIDKNLQTQSDQISVLFDAGQSYKTIPKGSTMNLSPFSIPLPVRRLCFQSPTANAPFELMLAVI